MPDLDYGKVNAGRNRNWLELQHQPDRTAAPDGQLTVGGWLTKRIVRCDIRGLSGREQFNAAQQKATVSHLITLRYQGTDSDGKPFVRAEMRGVCEGRIFNFTAVVDVDNRHRRLEVMALELTTPIAS